MSRLFFGNIKTKERYFEYKGYKYWYKIDYPLNAIDICINNLDDFPFFMYYEVKHGKQKLPIVIRTDNPKLNWMDK